MNVSIEDKKKEAVSRMKKVGIFPETVHQFERGGKVSESAPPLGACFWLNEEQQKRAKEFEEKYDALVYHVIHTFTEIGEMESYLYVSDHSDEWEDDRNMLSNGEVYAYVYNKDYPQDSEIGMIGFKLTPAAGLARIW